MSSSESDNCSYWNEQLLSAVRMREGKGPKISEQYIIEKMRECLDQGADINTLDKKNNTVLHIAVRKGYQGVVEFLLQNGARTNIRNQTDDTAITLAQNSQRKEIADIMEKLCDAQPSTSRKGTFPNQHKSPKRMFVDRCNESGFKAKRKRGNEDKHNGTTKIQRTDSNDSPQLVGTKNRVIETPRSDCDNMYLSGRTVKDTLHGTAYQWKHLMLILHRAWAKGYSFRLATEMDAAEKFDDVVLEYEDSEKGKVHRFMQIKHRQNDEKMVTATDLLNAKDGSFSLLKYFKSWREIRKNPIFKESKSKEFILCTNVDLDVAGLNKENIKVKNLLTDDLMKVTVDLKLVPHSEKSMDKRSILCHEQESATGASNVNELEKFDDSSKATDRSKPPPRFHTLSDSDKTSVLRDNLLLASDVHKLAREIAVHVCGSSDKPLEKENIKYYHAALALNVIDTTENRFFCNFINNVSLSKKAKKFRKIFIDHAIKNSPPNMDEEQLWKSLEQRKLTLSENVFDTKPELTKVDEFVEWMHSALHDGVIKFDKRRYNKKTKNHLYRVVAENIVKLAGHVLITKNKKIKFRQGFLNDNTPLQGNMEEFRIALKTKFGSEFTNLRDVEFEINEYKTCTEEGFELPDDNIEDNEIENFLSGLILAVNQPNEIELCEMIKHEIRNCSQFNLQKMDFIWDSFQTFIVNWLKQTGRHSRFLGNADAKAFFKEIGQSLSSLTTMGVNLIYKSELKKYDIKFERQNKDLRRFLGSSSSEQFRILELISPKQTLLTAMRVYQALENSKKYKEKDSHIFIQLKKLLLRDIRDEVLRAFESSHSHGLIVIDCASHTGTRDVQDLWNRLDEIIMRSDLDKRMILIIQGNAASAIQFRVRYQIFDEEFTDISNLKECSQRKLLERSIIKFQGHDERTSFGRLLGVHDCGNIESEKLSSLRRIIDQETLTQLIRGEEIPIGSKVIGLGVVKKYYIPRTITGHVVIKRSVLKDPKIPDLFAISGIDFESLEKWLAPEKGTHEFDECNEPKLDPDKCYFLDEERVEDHFKNICEENSDRNIHWLQAESEKLLWKKSHGNITDLMAFEQTVLYDKNNMRPGVSYFTEDQLMDYAEKCQIVIISDIAGMGKSTVLTYFAEEMKQKHSSSLVIKIDLTRHTAKLKEQEQEQIFDFTDTNNAVDFLVDKLSCLDTELERKVFKEIIKVTGGAVLLFDGFDEISPEFECTVTELLQALSRLDVKKLCVTTRSHTVTDLEKNLETFSHNLLPFTPKNQVDFLISFWGKGMNLSDYDRTKKRLEEHASSVLQILAKSINHQMQEFIGIPLLTWMVAEVFPFNEKVNPEYFDPSKKTIDIIDIYKGFVDEKYRIYCQEKKFEDDTNQGQSEDRKKLHQIFLRTHKKLALEALFDEETVEALLRFQSKEDQDENDRGERIGIVTQVISGKPHFVHRTFAEYFAAQFIIDTLMNNCRNQQVRKFFITKLFVARWYDIIRKFLNTLLSSRDYLSDSEKNSWKCRLPGCQEDGDRPMPDENLYHVAVNQDHFEIIKFFSHRLGKTRTGSRHHNCLQPETDINCDNLIGYRPLILAIENNNLPIVNFLLDAGANFDTISDYQKDVRRDPSVFSAFDELKRQYVASAVIHPITENLWTPLNHAVQIGNLDTVRRLLEAGADINHQMGNGWTPLHHAVKLEDLKMVELLVENRANINFPYTVDLSEIVIGSGKKDVNYNVTYTIDVSQIATEGAKFIYNPNIKDIWGVLEFGNCVPGDSPLPNFPYTVDVSEVKAEDAKYIYNPNMRYVWDVLEMGNCVPGDSPLHFAAKTTNFDMIMYLIEKGADINSRSALGWTPLHVAVATNNMKIVKYLVLKHANINSEADHGLTPLQIADHFQYSDMVQCLVDLGGNRNAEAKYGLTEQQLLMFHKEILRHHKTSSTLRRNSRAL